ncbi:MAG: hypothetical protein Q4A45_01660 [Clostridia bacterium]|nr:hypothetical protein [Clostridia bacterium]
MTIEMNELKEVIDLLKDIKEALSTTPAPQAPAAPAPQTPTAPAPSSPLPESAQAVDVFQPVPAAAHTYDECKALLVTLVQSGHRAEAEAVLKKYIPEGQVSLTSPALKDKYNSVYADFEEAIKSDQS